MVPRAAPRVLPAALLLAVLLTGRLTAAAPERVLVVVNDNSPVSRAIGEYYVQRRAVPLANVCHLKTTTDESIEREDYNREIARPIGQFLRQHGLRDSVYYIVTTAGVPLKIPGSGSMQGTAASVDSELTLLYADLTGAKSHALAGGIPNPFFGKRDTPFSHPRFPIYLVTRLAAYDLAGVKSMIDRSLRASNRGKFVIDLGAPDDHPGNDWLRNAAILLPQDRVKFDESTKPVYDQTDVIGYASWGSNDPNHNRRFPGFHWLPGGIVTEYVSTDGRTFARPPERWVPGQNWVLTIGWFAGSPQSLVADSILEGATGGSGHVYEPYLTFTPRPDMLLPAYYSGRNLAESYYLAIPALSWQNIVVGDPLCSLGKP
jgi:uncharacterized protein (TIGR03790 family)